MPAVISANPAHRWIEEAFTIWSILISAARQLVRLLKNLDYTHHQVSAAIAYLRHPLFCSVQGVHGALGGVTVRVHGSAVLINILVARLERLWNLVISV